MKRVIITTLALVVLTTLTLGQEKRPRFRANMELMRSERVSFLTNKLQLTVDEAEKFWPLYNEYQKKREELFFARQKMMPRNFDPAKATDKDLEEMLNNMLDEDVKLAELKREYFLKIREALPVRKVLMLHRAEQEFMNHLLNRIHEGGSPGGGDRSGRDFPTKSPLPETR
ncbi:MAG: hypothetical protein M0P69_10715 [Bacteroidales bacterium]|jgi:DNA polymerase III delta prime subunit|nr:hypothetical protein [Bacteroidales bacterium]MDD2570880.1 hypothetical protein [Bacteroidales bacterium]MDD2813654.1 hypothetical protein [Bacteroidales bacterium]MDD3384466.1 hypothetical protein [Bacteroidales bacterium]MDD3811948.1 hypothetical protein [Bacteroidales bacterium]